MKQFASWFTHGIAGGAALRRAIFDSKQGADILHAVDTFFAVAHEREPAEPSPPAFADFADA